MTVRSGAALGRLVSRAAGAAEPERCELCSAPLPDPHRHLLDLPEDQLRCVCRGCALLFERDMATPQQYRLAPAHYRLVPQRRLRLPPPEPGTGGTEAAAVATGEVETGVPVGLAFYVLQQDGQVIARYPGPAGVTSAGIDPAGWSALLRCWPQLAQLLPGVEALLVNTAHSAREYWIVPIDDCYRLVAVIRQHWAGFAGGREVWPAVAEFFAGLAGPPHGRRAFGTG